MRYLLNVRRGKDLTEGLNTGMKTTGITTSLVFGALMMFAGPASAECACFCVDGELKTMCTSVGEAQENPAMCGVYSHMACPEEPGDSASASYDAPEEGATNCRDLRVYDALRGVFTSVKACDVLSAS